MKYKQLLFLEKEKAQEANLGYLFNFYRPIRFNRFKLKYISQNNYNMKIYIHCPELADKSINQNLDGVGRPTDIVGLINTANQNNEENKHTLFLNKESVFEKLSFYFTDKDGNRVNMNSYDFTIILDVEKSTEIF